MGREESGLRTRMGRRGCGARIRLDDQSLCKGNGLIGGDTEVSGSDGSGGFTASLPKKLPQQGLAFNFTQTSRHGYPVVQAGIGRNIHQ